MTELHKVLPYATEEWPEVYATHFTAPDDTRVTVAVSDDDPDEQVYMLGVYRTEEWFDCTEAVFYTDIARNHAQALAEHLLTDCPEAVDFFAWAELRSEEWTVTR